MKFDKQDKVVKAPDALNNPLYKLTKAVVRAAKIKNRLCTELCGELSKSRSKVCHSCWKRYASLLCIAILHSRLQACI